MLLDVRDLAKSFGTGGTAVSVLDGVSLTLDAGEVVALTGESGSGKSTLLHIVGGLEPADGGAVLFEGADIAQMDDSARASLRRTAIGMVFQQFNLIPSLSVRQNLVFQARLAGRTAPGALAEQLGLEGQLDKYPEDLSGGQQQRQCWTPTESSGGTVSATPGSGQLIKGLNARQAACRTRRCVAVGKKATQISK